jgi:hypothetical protein
MNTQLTIFLVRQWWWLWPLCALLSVLAGVLRSLSLLSFAVASPCLVLMLAAEKEGLQRALSFMTLRRREVQRSLWMVLVLLPGVLLFVGVLGGSGLATVLEWKWRVDLSALHLAVAVGHAEILLVGVYVLAQTTKSKIGVQSLQTASGLLPMVMIVSGQYLDRSEREAVLEYLNHPAAQLVALLALPLALWSWKVAPELGRASFSGGNEGRTKVKHGDQVRARAARGLRGIKLLFGMEVLQYGWLIASTVGVYVGVLLGVYGFRSMRSGTFDGTNLFVFVWFMPTLFLLWVTHDLKALRLFGVSARKLAGLMLVAPVLCAVVLTGGLARMSPSSGEGWGVVALFGVSLGSACCLRLIGLFVPYYGVVLFIGLFVSLSGWIGFGSFQIPAQVDFLWVIGGMCGTVLAACCWWVLVRSFSRGRYIYALNQKQVARMQPLKGG